ncbi:glycosyltransferase [Aurantiacibacter hainanensis]|uniref:glycosyltransferase n=1 Tax=Aurantiacibacter hainanensis TaxID=3076114 RepID=UPI0030C71C28
MIAGLGAHNGGPSYSVPRLAKALSDLGSWADIYTVVDCSHEPPEPNVFTFPQDWGSMPVLSGLRASRSLSAGLEMRAADVDILHNHGLWLMPNVAIGRVAAKSMKPLIVSPRGMLAPEALRFSAWKKKLFWALLQKPAFKQVVAWHATSQEEADDIRAFGIEAPIAIIPNGVDVTTATAKHDPRRQKRTALFLSRLHPKKGLPGLIAAWAEIALQRPSWELVIAGPDEGGHRAKLTQQIEESGATSIRFAGPIYGSEKARLLTSADLFVLPTKSENFGIAVAEALAAGVPAIVTKGAPWSGLREQNCGWWIDHGTEPLKATLLEATALPSEVRKQMGARGRAWVLQDFGWDAIGREMDATYRWVAGNGDFPSCMYPA